MKDETRKRQSCLLHPSSFILPPACAWGVRFSFRDSTLFDWVAGETCFVLSVLSVAKQVRELTAKSFLNSPTAAGNFLRIVLSSISDTEIRIDSPISRL